MSQTKKIIEMIRQGKISTEDGERLIKAVRETGSNEPQKDESIISDIVAVPVEKNRDRKHPNGKIVVSITSVDDEEVKINLPLKLASFAVNMIPAKALDSIKKEGFNIKEIIANVSEMIDEIDEDIINIKGSKGDRVRIYFERY